LPDINKYMERKIKFFFDFFTSQTDNAPSKHSQLASQYYLHIRRYESRLYNIPLFRPFFLFPYLPLPSPNSQLKTPNYLYITITFFSLLLYSSFLFQLDNDFMIVSIL